MCWPPAGQLRAGKTAHLATPDTLAPQVIPHLQAAMQALRRAAPVRAWLVDPGQDLRQRRVPHGPLRRRPGPARRVRPRGDRDAVRSQGTADRHDPETIPVGIDERADRRRSGSCSRAKNLPLP